MKRPTHCQRVYDLLSDGQWHTHHEGYALGVILHSRVADLRKKGHTIEHRRNGDVSEYRLLPESSVSGGTAGDSESSSAGVGHSAVTGSALESPREDSGRTRTCSPASIPVRPPTLFDTPNPRTEAPAWA